MIAKAPNQLWGADAAGILGVFDRHVPALDYLIELGRQFQAPTVFGAAIGQFHDNWQAPARLFQMLADRG